MLNFLFVLNHVISSDISKALSTKKWFQSMGLHQTYLGATAQSQDKNKGTTDLPQGYTIPVHGSIIDFIF